MPPAPGPLPPPPSPADFSGFCDPPSCVVHAVARHPDGGLAVFMEVWPGASSHRGEGVSELFEPDGTVRRIARGVVVLRGEFDSDGNLHALVEPQWDFAADATDTAVTDSPAVAVFSPAGDVASVRVQEDAAAR